MSGEILNGDYTRVTDGVRWFSCFVAHSGARRRPRSLRARGRDLRRPPNANYTGRQPENCFIFSNYRCFTGGREKPLGGGTCAPAMFRLASREHRLRTTVAYARRLRSAGSKFGAAVDHPRTAPPKAPYGSLRVGVPRETRTNEKRYEYNFFFY